MFCKNRHHVFLPDLGEESLHAPVLSGEETGLLLGGFEGLDPPPDPLQVPPGLAEAPLITLCHVSDKVLSGFLYKGKDYLCSLVIKHSKYTVSG